MAMVDVSQLTGDELTALQSGSLLTHTGATDTSTPR